MDRATLASMIDHTLLRAEATRADVVALCREARTLGVAAVCVSPHRVALAAASLGSSMPVAAVVGFPSGAHVAATKAVEADEAVSDGAREVDMVVPLGAALEGEWDVVAAHVAAVRAAVPTVMVKVIIESALFDPSHLAEVCWVVVDAGADYVKTSTGFHPAGGATVEAVTAMRAAVGPSIGIKASGGIRDAATALAMIDAGATRLGASATAAILDGL